MRGMHMSYEYIKYGNITFQVGPYSIYYILSTDCLFECVTRVLPL